MIENILTTCGLNQSEQKILLHLLKNGSSFANNIAKQTGLKRPTVYAILDNLSRTGLVEKHKKNSTTKFSNIEPHLIPKVFEKRANLKLQEIQTASKVLGKELEKYTRSQPHEIAGYEIKTVESAQSVYTQLEEVLLTGNFRAIFNPQKSINTLELKKLVKTFLEKTGQTKPEIKEIVAAGPQTDWYLSMIKNPNHQIKIVPHDKTIIADIIITSQSVFILHYNPQQEVGIKITQEEYYQSMSAIFDLLWEKLS